MNRREFTAGLTALLAPAVVGATVVPKKEPELLIFEDLHYRPVVLGEWLQTYGKAHIDGPHFITNYTAEPVVECEIGLARLDPVGAQKCYVHRQARTFMSELHYYGEVLVSRSQRKDFYHDEKCEPGTCLCRQYDHVLDLHIIGLTDKSIEVEYDKHPSCAIVRPCMMCGTEKPGRGFYAGYAIAAEYPEYKERFPLGLLACALCCTRLRDEKFERMFARHYD